MSKIFNTIEEHSFLMLEEKEDYVEITFDKPIHLEPPRPPTPIQTGKRTKLLTILWTPEEDAKLKELVKAFGTSDWHKISKSFLRHNSRQCKERWAAIKPQGRYFLKPCLFTREEDVLLWKKVQQYGKKWELINKCFTGKTEEQLKTRYQTLKFKVRNYIKKATTDKYLIDEITDLITKRSKEPPLPRCRGGVKINV